MADNEELVTAVRNAVFSCPHTIIDDEIVLRRSDRYPGNATGQLHSRLAEVISRYGAGGEAAYGWEAYWGGAGSVDSVTRFTTSPSAMAHFKAEGAQITPLYRRASIPTQTREAVLEEAAKVADAVQADIINNPHEFALDAGGRRAAEKIALHIRALASSPAPEPAVQQRGGWTPIETAPKDGTWIEAFRPREGIGTKSLTVHVRWHQFGDGDSAWIWPDDIYEVLTDEGRYEAERLIDRGDIYEDATHFTHWRPLPAPPTSTESQP